MRPREYHLFEGEPVTISVASPGAGNQFSYNLLANYVYLLVGVEFLFTTGGAAGNRNVRLHYNTGTLVQHWSVSYTQATGLVRRYSFGLGGGTAGFSVSSIVQGVLPDRWYLEGGSIDSAILALLATDAITDITLNFLRWADI